MCCQIFTPIEFGEHLPYIHVTKIFFCNIYIRTKYNCNILQGEFDDDGDGSESGAAEETAKYLLCPEDASRNIRPPIEAALEAAGVLCPRNEGPIDPETQARLEAVLEAAGNLFSALSSFDPQPSTFYLEVSFSAGIGKLQSEDKYLNSEILQRLTSSVSCALDEAAAALTRMRSDQPKTNTSEKR